MVPILKQKGDFRNCSCYGVMKPPVRGTNVVERVLERLHRIVSVDKMKFGFMPERGQIDGVFIL